MKHLFQPWLDSELFASLERRISSGTTGTCLTGLVEGSRALALALAAWKLRRKLLVVLPDDAAVDAFRRDLISLAPLVGIDPKRILLLPALDSDPYDAIAPHPEVVRERVVALSRLQRGDVDFLITPVRAALVPLASPEEWKSWTRVVRCEDKLPPDLFVLRTMGLGYRRVDIVSAPGEVSRRGGIIDIFPPNLVEPVRIELFGDAVESLRTFDTDRQRSTGQLDEVTIGPATENPPTDEALRRLADHLRAGERAAKGKPTALRQFRAQLDLLQNQGHLSGFEALARLTVSRPVELFEHARDMVLVVDEPEQSESELLRSSSELAASYEQSGNRVFPAPAKLFADAGKIRDHLREASVFLHELAGERPPGAGEVIHVPCRRARSYAGRFQDLAADLREARKRRVRTLCVMRATGSADRLREILSDYELEAATHARGTPAPAERGGLFLAVGGLRTGFELPELGLSVLSERDILGEKRKQADRRSKRPSVFISDFRDLKQGNLVVHVDHGVARYVGLGRPKGGSLNRDFMVLEFQKGDRLFVPVDRLDLVQKYNGVGGKKPPLDRLGGPGWERVKARVRKSVESMAHELLELYARRKTATGHRFSPDSAWQAELESAFPFELTPDQERAVVDIKRDMESGRPTDRLLVGDVGYGKTEVAVRAAFKAVMDGFQVALLAPTTVLAAQHHETFRDRYAPFPVRVETVSRFRSAAEIRAILQDTALGQVDVLIGTHRLLSRDVEFKQLGLLVVDEEQRFGVAHKERMKRLSVGIDVLSMTATPIPRTLQMSLAGVRDLSIIETPPPGRMAIQTYLVPFRKNVIAQALRQELRRNGQVFVVHNKVATLPAIARAIANLAPDARIVMAHGQMNERQLEHVMLRFVNHEADILVTTTIIENGLDIPRANTIIVNRADRFGLAQLYQLRGRVGRSHEHAYAYFMIPGRDNLTSEARKRLRALQEFSELGAGFRLAAADLEIRGAGELLGAKQHGHIASLGFDLYCQMLENAVDELKGEQVRPSQPVGLHLGVDIKISDGFLPDSGDRLVIYKRLAQASTLNDVDRLRTETEDRYGHLPPSASNLFAMAGLRVLAAGAGVKSIDLAESKLEIRFHDAPSIDPSRVLELIASRRGTLSPGGTLRLPALPRGVDRIEAVRALLVEMLGDSAA